MTHAQAHVVFVASMAAEQMLHHLTMAQRIAAEIERVCDCFKGAGELLPDVISDLAAMKARADQAVAEHDACRAYGERRPRMVLVHEGGAGL